MATIFYRTDRGAPGARPIYGVHPDGDIAVPADVLGFEVAEPADAIAWPVPAGLSAGREAWSVVDTTTDPPTLALDPASADAAIKAQVDEAARVDNLIDKLRTATPAEIQDWMQTNVTDLASARNALTRLAIGLAYALRRP